MQDVIFLDISTSGVWRINYIFYPQLQMEKLSSREAIAELMTWLDHVEQQQGHEEPISAQSSVAQVRSLLQKYKVNGKLKVQAYL